MLSRPQPQTYTRGLGWRPHPEAATGSRPASLSSAATVPPPATSGPANDTLRPALQQTFPLPSSVPFSLFSLSLLSHTIPPFLPPHFPLLSFSPLSTFPPSFCLLPLSLHLCFSFFFPRFLSPLCLRMCFHPMQGSQFPSLPSSLQVCFQLPSTSDSSRFFTIFLPFTWSFFLSTIPSASFPHPSVLSSFQRTPSFSAPHPDWMRSHFFVSFEVKTHFLEFPGKSWALKNQESREDKDSYR